MGFLKLLFYAILLTPLWVLSIFLFPFITSKILYFRILVELVLIFYVILALRYPEIRPRWTRLTKTVWIYLGVILLASILGLDFGNSFMGNVERGEGIITMLHFAAYFTMLPGVFRTKAAWRRYFMVILMVSLFTAVYGFAQLQCHDHYVLSHQEDPSVCHVLLPTGGTRISATIGNASFFAAFAIFGVFLSLYLLQDAANFRQRVFLAAVFFFELYILFETQTRGAVLAAALAFVIYFLFNLFKSRRRRIRLASLGGLIILILSGILIYVNRESAFVQKNRTLYRLATISPKDITTQSRLDTWQASWLGWQDRFFLGWGYENYNLAFNKYFPARIFKDQGSQIWFDRAHNAVFDVAVNSGIIGLAAYLAIFLSAFVTLFRLYRKNPVDLSWQHPVILGVLLMAYFLQNFFVFDTQATYLMFFLVLGYIVFLDSIYLSEAVPEKKKTSYPAGFVLSVILTVFLFLVVYFVNLKPAYANYYTTQGIKKAKLNLHREVVPTFQKALSYGTYMDEEIRQRLVDHAYEVTSSIALSPQEKEEVFSYLISELQKSIKGSAHDVKNYLYLMNVYNRVSTPQNLDQAIELGERALQLSPTRPQIYFELGQAYFSKKEFEKGLAYFRQAIELNPEPKESHFNYLLAGIIAKRQDIIEEEMKRTTQDLGYKFSVQDYLGIARAYAQNKDFPKIIEYLKNALALTPNDPNLHGQLAAAYREICDIANAQVHVKRAVELSEAFTVEANTFLQQLEQECKKT